LVPATPELLQTYHRINRELSALLRPADEQRAAGSAPSPASRELP